MTDSERRLAAKQFAAEKAGARRREAGHADFPADAAAEGLRRGGEQQVDIPEVSVREWQSLYLGRLQALPELLINPQYYSYSG